MRLTPTLVVLGCLAAAPGLAAAQVPAGAAAETTIPDLLQLQAAGMPDEILIALFQSNGTTFYLTADDLIYLRQQGLSERVLLAMLATRQPPAQVRPEAVAAERELARPAAAGPGADPVVVNVDQRNTQTVEVEAPRASRTETRIVQVPVPVAVAVPRGRRGVGTAPVKAPEPVYWGFGGQRRPDSWLPRTPPKTEVRPDPRSRVGRGTGTGGGGGGGGGR